VRASSHGRSLHHTALRSYDRGVGTDLIGRPTEPAEDELLEVYARLRSLAARDDLAPCVTANVRSALAACWNAINDLGLDYEHLLDVGV